MRIFIILFFKLIINFFLTIKKIFIFYYSKNYKFYKYFNKKLFIINWYILEKMSLMTRKEKEKERI
jgi:hypothetical protein